MKVFGNKWNFLAIVVMAMMLAAIAPATSFGQDDHDKNRGRENWQEGQHRGRDNRNDGDWSRRNRKCGKFVNCHDARDGRWDRGGPRGERVGNVVWRTLFAA